MSFDRKACEKVYRQTHKEALQLKKKLWASTSAAKELHKMRSKRYQNKAKAKPKLAKARKKYRSTPRGKFVMAKLDAKRKNKQWTLTEELYTSLVQRPCNYCDGAIGISGIGLDRIDNSLGYTELNVLPCCCDCNRTRGDRFTVAETRAIMDFIKEYRNDG